MMYARSRGTYYVQVLCLCSDFFDESCIYIMGQEKETPYFVCDGERIFKIDQYLIFIKCGQQYGISFYLTRAVCCKLIFLCLIVVVLLPVK